MQLLYISEDTRIGKVKADFNAHYPFLKIDFLKDNAMPKTHAHETEKINGKKISHTIDINKQRTVAQLKKDFKDIFGLTAEVFRKSGSVWIETTLTDDWTLEQQNDEAEFISSHSKK